MNEEIPFKVLSERVVEPFVKKYDILIGILFLTTLIEMIALVVLIAVFLFQLNFVQLGFALTYLILTTGAFWFYPETFGEDLQEPYD